MTTSIGNSHTLSMCFTCRKYEKCVSGEVFDSVLTKVSGELGFCVEKKPSGLVNGGTGVFVTRGKVAKHSLTAIYPGEK